MATIVSANTDQEREAVNAKIQDIAMFEAVKASFAATAAVGAATALATYKSKNFSKFMSISAKTSLPVMAGLGTFGYRYEVVQWDAHLYPEHWGLAAKGATKVSKMPFHHKALNYFQDNTFKFIGAMGVPLAGAIFYKNMQLKHLSFSQKVMHTRVFAQFGVISILLVTMGLKEYMDRHGRFPEPGEEITKD